VQPQWASSNSSDATLPSLMKEQTFIQKGKKGGTKKRGPTSNQETTSKNANPPMGAAKESSNVGRVWNFSPEPGRVSSGSLTQY